MPGRRPIHFSGATLDARADAPDFRDFIYEPPLIRLKASLPVPANLNIRDQGTDGSCTGFGLAAAIDLLIRRSGRRISVSSRMLYEMAKHYDEWRGHLYEGSSCRGTIKGWYNMGVCRESYYPYDPDNIPRFTVRAAKDARSNTAGAYYRIGPRISDYHAALNETGVVYCSAAVHDGWDRPDRRTGTIPFVKEAPWGHAFAIVGYDRDGFRIQNSWGRRWGQSGTALWTYEDWITNVRDAWVFRLAVPTPQIWHLPPGQATGRDRRRETKKPTRAEIAGHFVHLDDGFFHGSGRYWSDADDVGETAALVGDSADYDHVLFYAHGGLNSPAESARRIAAMKETFKDNRIYPYHFMYDTGLMEELKDVVIGRRKEADGRAGGLSDWTDRLVEKMARRPGRALWREMKAGARLPFEDGNAGHEVLETFIGALANSGSPKQIHVAGHSTGMILMSYLLHRLAELTETPTVGTVSLLAPAGTLSLFRRHIQPLLETRRSAFRVRQIAVYNLTDRLERDDEVTLAYNKSLLYLVSRAFEDELPARLLGMQKYSSAIERKSIRGLKLYYSKGSRSGSRVTRSETHGGFDNDPYTMNHILRRILEHPPARPFTKTSLTY